MGSVVGRDYVRLRVRVGGGWLGACMWHARGEQRRRAADGSVALRAAAAAWAARVVAHPPLRRVISGNAALTSLKLNDNRLSKIGIQAIAKALVKNTTLQLW